jgi:hypothetical protein
MHGVHTMQLHTIVCLAKPEYIAYLGIVVLVIIPAHGLAANKSHALLIVVPT